ncbi:MAG: glutaredoxin family protein [Telluria sp.]
MNFVTTSNVRRGACLTLALLLCMGSASAQVFKWVDANGKTHFSDQPPPATAKPSQMKQSGGTTGGVALPYALATAVRNFPVTLFTTDPCGACDQGRNFLKARGIPFTEKTVATEADLAKLKEAGGNGSMPFLTVGKTKSTGFQAEAWSTMLNVALYPATKMLPASYQYPTAVSAAPKPVKAEPDQEALRVAAAAQEQEKRRKEAAQGKPKSPTAPPGFQF